MIKNISVTIGGVLFKNPVFTASGTFGSGREYVEFIDLNALGAVTVKGVSDVPWPGNQTPRVAEVYGGMLNAIGLQNPGAESFIAEDIPFLRGFDTKIIVNVCGHTVDEYVRAAESFNDADVDMLELNISCPNICEGGQSFGKNPKITETVVAAVKKRVKHPLAVKLSPNVTDITEIARAAESAGADALSLINTLQGMKIDIHKRKPVLANKFGGFSGPAIKPVAIAMVYQTARAVKLPIIGMGGVTSGEDAIEFLLAGASAVSVGTANFMNPAATVEVLNGIEKYMEMHGIEDVRSIIGGMIE